jgi:hypothetical protein
MVLKNKTDTLPAINPCYTSTNTNTIAPNNIPPTTDSVILTNSEDFNKNLYDKIFTFNKKKIINTSNDNFMKNMIDSAIKKNKVTLTYG